MVCTLVHSLNILTKMYMLVIVIMLDGLIRLQVKLSLSRVIYFVIPVENRLVYVGVSFLGIFPC